MEVCVVIVTYNRKQYLIKLLEKLKEQTYKIAKIVIFDNNSTDGTSRILEEEGYLSTDALLNVTYHKSNENLGGSGGFYYGLKIAMKYNPDFIWVMDDDVLPERDCLEELIANMDNNVGICIPNRTGNGFYDYAITKVDMVNPFLYGTMRKKTKMNTDKIQMKERVCDMPFEGPLIRAELIKNIGYPNKDLFILYDDSEYAMRACKISNILFVKNAHLYKQIVSGINQEFEVFSWKDYYDIRNGIWFDRNYGENLLVKYIRPILTVVYWYLRLVKKEQLTYIKYVNKAYVDAIRNRLGKEIDPQKWR